jgi:hypothetical protein
MILLLLILTLFLFLYLISFKPSKSEIKYRKEDNPAIHLKILNERFLGRNKFTIK